jgi:predicted DNA-binding transcriptional regulator AlpA
MTGTVKTRETPIRIKAVMELTGFSRSYIYKLVHWRKLPCHKPTNGQLFFYESEILDFLSRGKQSADYEIEEKARAIMSGIGRGRHEYPRG